MTDHAQYDYKYMYGTVFTYSGKHVRLKETKKTTSFPFSSPSTCKSYSQGNID